MGPTNGHFQSFSNFGCKDSLSPFLGFDDLSTFGNDLEPTSNWLEVIFSICHRTSGLLLSLY